MYCGVDCGDVVDRMLSIVYIVINLLLVGAMSHSLQCVVIFLSKKLGILSQSGILFRCIRVLCMRRLSFSVYFTWMVICRYYNVCTLIQKKICSMNFRCQVC